MNRVEVLTPWNVDNQMQVAIDYFGQLTQCNDATGQPSENLSPNPNQMVAEIVCDDTTLALIEADANYFVLTSKVIPDETV